MLAAAALSLATAALSLAAAALAQPARASDSAGPNSGPNCDLTGYKSAYAFSGLEIPDNDPNGVVLGYLDVDADGTLFDDVILELHVHHAWVGDLVVTLSWYPDCAYEGGVPSASATVLCRPRGTDAGSPAPCGSARSFGCSGHLSDFNTYLFSDDSSTRLADGFCAPEIPSGCYKPASGSSMSAFRGLAKGGCFRLAATDLEPGATGRVYSFGVHTRNTGPVPTRMGTWGQLKATYR